MAWLRMPIAGLMAAVVVLSVDASIIRTLYGSKDLVGTSLETITNRAVFAFGVFPVASLLIFVVLVRVPGFIRRGANAPFLFGFETFGWASIFLFITASTLSPPSVDIYLGHGLQLFKHCIRWVFTVAPALDYLLPAWFQEVFDCGPLVLLFGLPELGIALFGGWLTCRTGISVRIEPRRSTQSR